MTKAMDAKIVGKDDFMFIDAFTGYNPLDTETLKFFRGKFCRQVYSR